MRQVHRCPLNRFGDIAGMDRPRVMMYKGVGAGTCSAQTRGRARKPYGQPCSPRPTIFQPDAGLRDLANPNESLRRSSPAAVSISSIPISRKAQIAVSARNCREEWASGPRSIHPASASRRSSVALRRWGRPKDRAPNGLVHGHQHDQQVQQLPRPANDLPRGREGQTQKALSRSRRRRQQGGTSQTTCRPPL